LRKIKTPASYYAPLLDEDSMTRLTFIAAMSSALFIAPLVPSPPVSRVATEIVGGPFVHEIQAGETLASLAARYGVDPAVLARRNGRAPGARLAVSGDRLTIDNRHIVWPIEPASSGPILIINVPQRMLFRVVDGRVDAAFPVAVGRASWQTPRGPFTVLEKEVDPTWDVPLSIQEEMRLEGKPVVTSIPPCPANPLGRHWIRLSHPGVGLHGTNVPASIYRFATHGCIRLHPDDVSNLFDRVQVGDTGVTVYDPVLLARVEDGRFFVEVHPDPYKLGPDPLRHLHALAETAGMSNAIDWDRVRDVIRKREGVAVDVTRENPTPISGE
jgi:L,D-transpeptidase ErfK/SrfK